MPPPNRSESTHRARSGDASDGVVPADSFPTTGRIAAIDFGTVRTGVAICDPDWILASPLGVVAGGTPDDPQPFVSIADEERLAGWVVGLPVHADGGESASSGRARAFAKWLNTTTGLPVRLFDERFTTVEASQRMAETGKTTRKQTKKKIDAVAATILLEAFIEASRYGNQTPGYPLHNRSAEGLE